MEGGSLMGAGLKAVQSAQPNFVASLVPSAPSAVACCAFQSLETSLPFDAAALGALILQSVQVLPSAGLPWQYGRIDSP